ncbi:MAG: LpqB family beta-propeller domain-containing protein [Jatrophihabitans sp.]
MRRRRRISPLLVLLPVAALVIGGCSGIPSDSTPQVVKTLPAVEQPSVPVLKGPSRDAVPREIVNGFLAANVTNDAEHTVAQQFLTADARSKWTSSTVTVVADLPRVSTPDGDVITVTADKVNGRLDSSGLYTPTLATRGGVASQQFRFTLARGADHQWRISDLPAGLIVTEEAFETSYSKDRTLYFFDSSSSHLIPDVRYTAVEGQSLSSWLLDELLAGPRPGLPSTVAVSALPPVDQRDASATLTGSGSLTINLPGVSNVDPTALTRIAAQLAFTYESAGQDSSIRIVDGSKPITVSGSLTTFTSEDFTSFSTTPNGSPVSYYLKGGLLYEDTASNSAQLVSGTFGSGRVPLRSVAVRAGQANDAEVAGVRSDTGQLVLGSQRSSQVNAVTLPAGPLSRPEWDPVTRQVWIGAGKNLEVVNTDGVAQSVKLVTLQGPLPATPYAVKAVRLSPERSRIALVLGTASASSVWIGAVNASTNRIEVDALTQISPDSQVAADLGWSLPTALTIIGSAAGTGDLQIWTEQVDGAINTLVPTTGLPGAPTAIATNPSADPIVSTGAPALWQQTGPGASWVALGGKGQLTGMAPIFAI